MMIQKTSSRDHDEPLHVGFQTTAGITRADPAKMAHDMWLQIRNHIDSQINPTGRSGETRTPREFALAGVKVSIESPASIRFKS